MANTQTAVPLTLRQLTSFDAAGLKADVTAQSVWQPTAILESDHTAFIALPAGITTAADIWRLEFQLPSVPTPAFAFYPIVCAAHLQDAGLDAGFVNFWEAQATYQLRIAQNGSDRDWNQDYTLGTPTVIMEGGGAEINSQAATPPELRGFPFPTVNSPTDPAMGSFQFTVDTFDAGAAANMFAFVDVRWLVYPETAIRSAGFYAPQQWYRTS